MNEYHFTVRFFSMKNECVVIGHFARIELSVILSHGSIGLRMRKTMMMVTMGLVVGVAGVVDVSVVGVGVGVVDVGVGVVGVTMVSEVVVAIAAIRTPVDVFLVAVLQSLVPAHPARCSFLPIHSQILLNSKHSKNPLRSNPAGEHQLGRVQLGKVMQMRMLQSGANSIALTHNYCSTGFLHFLLYSFFTSFVMRVNSCPWFCDGSELAL